MRAFDDTTRVVANVPRTQINDGIVKLQSIRREAEDLEVPVCLITLKMYGLAHMNAMIDTLLAFMTGADAQTVNKGVAKAQVQHEKYNVELSRLLGITYVPTPISTPHITQIPTTPITPSGESCAPQNIAPEIDKANQLMRAFDDWSQIATSTPKEKLGSVIANLQAIRRQTQDNPVSECLVKLKEYQLVYMETVVNTLLSFLSGSNSTLLNQGVELARSQHDQYNAEVASLLSIDVVVTGTVTPTPVEAQQVKNPGASPVNIREFPVDNASVLGILPPGKTVSALGKSLDGAWILVSIPDKPEKTGWIFASLLEIPDASILPQVTPVP
jgi:hypothetical protein